MSSSPQKDTSKSNDNSITSQPITSSPTTTISSSSIPASDVNHPSHRHSLHDHPKRSNLPSPFNALVDEDDLSDASSSSSASIPSNLKKKSTLMKSNSSTSTSENSEDEEYEVPSKEPYESKYITLTTINALDFLPNDDCTDSFSSDAVLTSVYKSTKMTFIWCLASSVISAGVFWSSTNRMTLVFTDISWATWFIICSLIWSFYLIRLNGSWPLGLTISFAKKISLFMTVTQCLSHISMWKRDLHSSAQPHPDTPSVTSVLFYGSVLSLPVFVILEHFLDAYQKEKFRKQALLKVERKNAQDSIYRAVDRFSERKGLYLRTISDVLRQTTDLAMGTLKQLSPPRFLSKPHEQLSACSISTPTTSINAIHTILKEVNYISTHLGTLSLLLFSDHDKFEKSNIKREFDIGELIQNVGDALAGVASCSKVELVIYHVEYGLNHLNVIGDEATLRHALLDLIICILCGASPGACVELGLQILRASAGDGDSTSEKERDINPNDKVTCTIEIIHNPGSAKFSQRKSAQMIPNANLVHKVLGFLGATLKAEEGSDCQRFEISIELEVGSPLAPRSTNEEILHRYPHSRITGEPSIEELIKTSQNMRGQRVALHATSKSFFAKHITSCLTTWGTDISHIPIGGEENLETSSRTGVPDLEKNSSTNSSSRDATPPLPPTFIIIDDDIETLKRQLTKLRNAPFQGNVASQLNVKPSPSRRRVQTPMLPQQTTAVIHFTSLSNYKQVKDSMQIMLSPASAGSFPLPQVLVIPKPAGPRRFLNALHTTTNKIVVDPVYMPIATSPMSPGSQYANGLHASSAYAEVNPMEQIGEQCSNYFPSDVVSIVPRSNTPSPSNSNVPRPAVNTSGSPLSPRGILIVPKQSRNSDGRGSKIEKFGKNNSASTTPSIYTSPIPTRVQSPRTLSPTSGLPPANLFPDISAVVTNSESPNALSNVPISTAPQPTTPQQTSTVAQNQPSSVHSKRRKTKPTSNRILGVIPPINVLIVEDNPINQTILSTFMKRKNIKFECATNGQEAVNKWQKGGFHLVLMDIHMPVMDGIEATKTIRRLEKSQKIGVFPSTPPAQLSESSSSSVSSTPVSTPASTPSQQDPPDNRSPVIIVALTASSLSSDKQNALAAGCNDFLTKPVSLEWLEKKINEWGCMQALIDFEGWKKWKKVGEEVVSRSNEKKSGTSKFSSSSSDKTKKGVTASEGNNVVRPELGPLRNSSIYSSSSSGSSGSSSSSGQSNKVDQETSNVNLVSSRSLKDFLKPQNSVIKKADNGSVPTSSNSTSPKSHSMLRSPSGGSIPHVHPNDASLSPLKPEILVKLRTTESDPLVIDQNSGGTPSSPSSSTSTNINHTDSIVSNNAINSNNLTVPSSTDITSPPHNGEPSQKRVGRKRGNTFSSLLNNNPSENNNDGESGVDANGGRPLIL